MEPFVPVSVRSMPSWSQPTAVASLIGAAAVLAVIVVASRRGRPGPLLATAFFVAQLGPTLGFLPFQFQCLSFIGDHFAYFACVGFFAAVCGVFFTDLSLWRCGAAGVLIVLLAVLTAKQASLFADPERLWSVNAQVNPRAWAAYTNLADLQLKRGAVREAVESARRAVDVEPANPMAQQILGTALAQAGRPAEAEHAFREGMRYSPRNPRFHHSLGNVFIQQDRWRDAIAEYQRAAELGPDFAMTHYLMGQAYFKLGMLEDARRAYEKALDIDPQMSVSREALGELHRADRGQSK
jgi:tetratricopeptide (TPR) repeat protein